MEEIKFRVYVYPDEIYNSEEIPMMHYFDLYEINGDINMIFTDKGGFDTRQKISGFMQYTGLKDKNEKEIYEGDICHVWGGEYFQGFNEIDFNGIVVFTSGSFCVKDNTDCHYDFGNIENVKVIGNIYENNKGN